MTECLIDIQNCVSVNCQSVEISRTIQEVIQFGANVTLLNLTSSHIPHANPTFHHIPLVDVLTLIPLCSLAASSESYLRLALCVGWSPTGDLAVIYNKIYNMRPPFDS